MLLSEFITQVNHGILQNYWTLMQDESDAIFHTSNMLWYIYSYRVWKWALVNETLESSNNTFTMSNEAVCIFNVKENQTQKPLTESSKPINTGEQNSDFEYFYSWKTLNTTWSISKIDVLYMKHPNRLSVDDKNHEIDLPDSYINILYLLVMWMMYPYNLENWASLANNFKNMADDVLKTYEKTHSLWIAPTSVQANEFFNWR